MRVCVYVCVCRGQGALEEKVSVCERFVCVCVCVCVRVCVCFSRQRHECVEGVHLKRDLNTCQKITINMPKET